MMRPRLLAWLVLFATCSAGAMAACSLNPQPIPPGLEDEGGATGGGADDGGGHKQTGDDSAAVPTGASDSDADGATMNAGDDAHGGQGDATDATDATDAPSDGNDAG